MNTLQKSILSVVAIAFFSSYSYVSYAQNMGLVAPEPVVTDTAISMPADPPLQIAAPAVPAFHADDTGEDTGDDSDDEEQDDD